MTGPGREMLPTVAVILAGGAGVRFGSGAPKQLVKVAGKSVIEHTLDALHGCEVVDEVMIVIAPAFVERVTALVEDRYPKLRALVHGGSDRNTSTRRAIDALGSTECKVLFHDAVRPFIDPATVQSCVRALDTADAVDVVVDSPDTIVEVDDDQVITDIPDRSRLRRGQTPQGFLLSVVREAYARAGEDGEFVATDDCAVVRRYLPDTRIVTVGGTEHNMKITYPLDLYIADRLFQHLTITPPPSLDPAGGEARGLRGRTLVVFGGSSGIGYELSRLARELGADVFSFSRSETGTDIRDAGLVEGALQVAFESTGRIDFVVNSAAVLTRGPLAEMASEAMQEQIATNFLAPALIARAALPFLQKSRGHLLLFTSSSYTRGRADYGLYSASKAAVVNLTQALADEWSSLEVKVNCVNPERTMTRLRTQNFGSEVDSTLLRPRTVAQACVDILQSSVTGHIVDVRHPQGDLT